MEFRSSARGRQWCDIIHYHGWTASIKPMLLFSRAGYASWGFRFKQFNSTANLWIHYTTTCITLKPAFILKHKIVLDEFLSWQVIQVYRYTNDHFLFFNFMFYGKFHPVNPKPETARVWPVISYSTYGFLWQYAFHFFILRIWLWWITVWWVNDYNYTFAIFDLTWRYLHKCLFLR